jgi:hypothetical protein
MRAEVLVSRAELIVASLMASVMIGRPVLARRYWEGISLHAYWPRWESVPDLIVVTSWLNNPASIRDGKRLTRLKRRAIRTVEVLCATLLGLALVALLLTR